MWVADAIGKRIVRVARGGRILEQIDTGELGIFAAALGGPDGRTLFMAAAPDFIEANRRAKPEGRILVARSTCRMRACPEHAGLPRTSGAGSPPRPAPAAVRRSRGLLPAPPPSSGSMWT